MSHVLLGTGRPIPVEIEDAMSISELEAARPANNTALLQSLKEDPHGVELLAMVKEEIDLGRMRCDSATCSSVFARS